MCFWYISVRRHQLLVTYVLLMHTLTIVFSVASREICVGNKCYVLVFQSLNQNAANEECQRLSYDSLASIADKNEQKALYTLLDSTQRQKALFWIGAKFENLSDWHWLNGQPYNISGTQESLYFTSIYYKFLCSDSGE